MDQDDIPHDLMTTILAYADWMTEDVAQRLYAARQDLADAAVRRPEDADEIDGVRVRLLQIVRGLHEIAGVLRESDAETLPVARIENLTARVERHCVEAEEQMTRGLALMRRADEEVVRPLPVRRVVRGDGPFARPLADGPDGSGPVRRASSG